MLVSLTDLVTALLPYLITAGIVVGGLLGWTAKVKRDATQAQIAKQQETDRLARDAAQAVRADIDTDMARGGDAAVADELRRTPRI
jgi:hypothetical protein